MKTCKQQIVRIFGLNSFWLWFAAAGIIFCGCQVPATQSSDSSDLPEATLQRVRISPLTDFAVLKEDPQQAEIKTYVELLDAANASVQKPGVFRFELYDYQPLLANPRGMRRVLWPDIDLTEPDAIRRHWREYLKSYEFYLPLEFIPAANQNYLLEVTCLADNKRYGGVLKIRYQP